MTRADVALHRCMHRLAAARLRFGVPGILGMVLLAVSAAALLDAESVHRETASGKVRFATLPARTILLGVRRSAPMSPDERLARFRDSLPTLDATVGDLRTIFRAAAASGLTLTRGDYSLTMVERSAGLAKYDAVFPLRGSYALVKRFVAEVLAQLPYAGLAALDVERPKAAAPEIDTRVHFILYYRIGDA